MGELDDYCQCCGVRLDEYTSYRCLTCHHQGYCLKCGKCKHHCKHAREFMASEENQ